MSNSTKFSENIEIIIWLNMNTGTISKNYNKMNKIQTSNIKMFEKHNYILLRNITRSHKNIHISYNISKNLHVTYKIFKKM